MSQTSESESNWRFWILFFIPSIFHMNILHQNIFWLHCLIIAISFKNIISSMACLRKKIHLIFFIFHSENFKCFYNWNYNILLTVKLIQSHDALWNIPCDGMAIWILNKFKSGSNLGCCYLIYDINNWSYNLSNDINI